MSEGRKNMIWPDYLDYLVPVAVSISISTAFSQIYLISPSFGHVGLSRFGLITELLITMFSVGLGIIGTSLFYYLLARRKDFEARLVAAVVFAPTIALLAVILGQTILLSVAKESFTVLVALIIVASIYASVFSTVFILTDILTKGARNLLYVFYGSILGGFLGLIFPSVMLVVILYTLAFYDTLMMRTVLSKRLAEDIRREKGLAFRFSYTGAYFQLGIGEFFFYSTLPAHVNANFDSLTLLSTVILILLGCLLNLKVLKGREYIAGIPLPVLLGTIPTIIKIFAIML